MAIARNEVERRNDSTLTTANRLLEEGHVLPWNQPPLGGRLAIQDSLTTINTPALATFRRELYGDITAALFTGRSDIERVLFVADIIDGLVGPDITVYVPDSDAEIYQVYKTSSSKDGPVTTFLRKTFPLEQIIITRSQRGTLRLKGKGKQPIWYGKPEALVRVDSKGIVIPNTQELFADKTLKPPPGRIRLLL